MLVAVTVFLVALVTPQAPIPVHRILPVLALVADQAEVDEDVELDAEDLAALARRPRTRAECIDGPRPCPWAGCKHSLLLDVARRTGTIRINPVIATTGESCSLDLAERGAHSQEEVQSLFGYREVDSVRQAERAAEAQMRVHGGEDLRAILRAYSEASAPPGEASNEGSLADVGFGGESPEHLRTPEIAARKAEQLDAWATQAAALVRGGLPVPVAWAVTNHLLEGGELATDDEADALAVAEGAQADEEAAALVQPGAAASTEGEPMSKEPKNVIPESPAKPSRRPPGELQALVLDELQRGGPGSVRDLAARIDAQVGNVRRVLKLAAADGLAHHDSKGSRCVWTIGARAPAPAPSEPEPAPAPVARPRSKPAKASPSSRRPVSRAGDRELVLALVQADEKRLELVARLLDRLGGR